MRKQLNGAPGKKPLAQSVKVSLHKLGLAEVDTAHTARHHHTSGPLTKVAYRSHINAGENSEIVRCGSIFGPVAGLVGIEGGVVSGVINLESPDVSASGRRPRHENRYHDA
jgi:hypothetical protein